MPARAGSAAGGHACKYSVQHSLIELTARVKVNESHSLERGLWGTLNAIEQSRPLLVQQGCTRRVEARAAPAREGGLAEVLADVRRLPVEVDEGARDGRVRLEPVL